MNSYAYYRLPYAETYTKLVQHHSEPLRLHSYAELDGRDGFVFAPFAITDDCPLLLLQPDEVEENVKDDGAWMKAKGNNTELLPNAQQPTFVPYRFREFSCPALHRRFPKACLSKA